VPTAFVRPIPSVCGASNLRKNVVAASPRRRQNVIASDAGRESLAGDSLDSDRIRVMEALAYAYFPKFFSQAIPCLPTTSTRRLQCCSRIMRLLEEASSCT
jgi:hypothetical protein